MPDLPIIPDQVPEVERAIHRALAAADTPGSEGLLPSGKARLRFSMIGKCPRLIWGAINGIPAIPKRWNREERRVEALPELEGRVRALFAFGHAVEEHVIYLLELAGFEVKGQQLEVTAFDDHARGHLDGLVNIGKGAEPNWMVLEVKSAKASRFDEIGVGYAQWDPEYYDQLQSYMGLAQFKKALVVVYCKDDSQIYVERVPFNKDRFDYLMRKAEMLIRADSPPPRPEEAPNEYAKMCTFCERKEWCWSPASDVRFDP